MKLALSAAGETRQGQKTSVNDDAVCFDAKAGLFAVADGSKRPAGVTGPAHIFLNVVKEHRQALAKAVEDAIETKEKRGTLKAMFQNVFDEGSSAIRGFYDVPKGKLGPTTTATVLVIRDGHGAIAHVGNTRAYLLRMEKIKRITKDHTVAQRKFDEKEITAAEYMNHPKKKTLWQAAGQSKSMRVDVAFFEVCAGDLFLLVSDGVSDSLRGDDLRQLNQQSKDSATLADAILDLANERDAKDDTSCVAIRLADADEQIDPAIEEFEEEDDSLIELGNEHSDVSGSGRLKTANPLAEVNDEPEPEFVPVSRFANLEAPAKGAKNDQLKYFKDIELFSDMSDEQILSMIEVMTPRSLQPGEFLFEQGTSGDEMFVITMGRIEVLRDKRRLVTLGAGTVVGELAMLDGDIRSASIRAERLSRVVGITRENLKLVEHRDSQFAITLYRNLSMILAKRLRAASGRR